MLQRLLQFLLPRRYYIIADTADDSITLSRALYRHILSHFHTPHTDQLRAFVFSIPHRHTFGFVINHQHDRPTIEAPILYNAKFKTIGFQSTCPSVNRIFYDYRIQDHLKVKLTIKILHLPNGIPYYEIQPPRPHHATPSR